MGKNFIDQYSLLHFSTGVISYFFNINIILFIIINIVFEYSENTKYGIYFINKYFPFWPGGKFESDSVINRIGDVLFGIIGWYTSQYLDQIYS